MPVRIDDDVLSDRYGLDKRTVHLLPAKCPEHPNPIPIPSTHPPYRSVAYNQAFQAMSNTNNNGYNYNNGYSHVGQSYWRRYVAILKKNGLKCFAKIVIQEDLEPWAKKRGFTVLKQNRLYGTVNEKLEKTEFSRRGSK